MRLRLALINETPYRLNNNLSAALNASGIVLATSPSQPTAAEVAAALTSYETKLKALRLDLTASTHNALVFTSGIPLLSSEESRIIQRVEFASGNLPTESAIST